MLFITVPNLNEIHPVKIFSWLKIVNQCEEEKCKENWQLSDFQKHISHKLLIRFSSRLVCKVVYMEGIEYVNLIEIGPVVIRYEVLKTVT